MKSYEQFGIAAVLPGLVRAAEVLQEEINSLQARLNGKKPRLNEKKPRKIQRKSPSATWWDNASPRQRKQRLAAMAAGKAKRERAAV